HRPTMVDISLLGDGGGSSISNSGSSSTKPPTPSAAAASIPQHPSCSITSHAITGPVYLGLWADGGSHYLTDEGGPGAAAVVGGGGRSLLSAENPVYGKNRLILDAFAQECSRVLTLLNSGRFVEPQDPLPSSVTSHIKQEESYLSGPGGESKPDAGQVGHCPTLGKPRPKESSTVDPDEEAQRSHWSQKQTYAFLHIFTKSLQSYLITGPQQPHPDLGLEGERGPPAESRVSPSNNLGGWSSPAPSESYGHPSSTLPEEEEEEEESSCPRCVELEQEMLCLQKENEELRNKLDNIPGTTVLQHHNQFIQPMSQEQQTEGSKQLLGNYPLFITNKQWDEAVNSSKKDGRRLLRYLIRFVFTTDELKYSCGLGKRCLPVH
uniref:BEN domain containing 4 n=1 Tax=Salmo trutta TaxID=8032 RepID=A0A673ZGH8_SALTR